MTPTPRRIAHTLTELTKARLVTLVLVTTGVGFVLAGRTPLDWGGLAWTLVGTGLAAAGVMSLNQGVEWRRDALMLRTRLRPVPSGDVSPRQAVALGTLLSAAGIAALAWRVNGLTALLGVAVVVLYVLVYTPLKTRTSLCTLAGAVCGAIPPMMGWSGAAGRIEFGAWILAALLFCWQIPHFLALAWLYREDYERGGFRMLPSLDPGGVMTGRTAVLYCLALLPIGVVAALSGLSGWVAAFGSLACGTALLLLGVQLARTRSDAAARRLFLGTLAYLPLLLALMVADRAAPDLAGAGSSEASLSLAGAPPRTAATAPVSLE
jgi:protoheme IX farnesyltransferase